MEGRLECEVLTRVNLYDMTRVSYTPKPPIWKTSPRISFMHPGSIPDVWTSQKNGVPAREGVRSDDPRIDCKIGRVNLKIMRYVLRIWRTRIFLLKIEGKLSDVFSECMRINPVCSGGDIFTFSWLRPTNSGATDSGWPLLPFGTLFIECRRI